MFIFHVAYFIASCTGLRNYYRFEVRFSFLGVRISLGKEVKKTPVADGHVHTLRLELCTGNSDIISSDPHAMNHTLKPLYRHISKNWGVILTRIRHICVLPKIYSTLYHFKLYSSS